MRTREQLIYIQILNERVFQYTEELSCDDEEFNGEKVLNEIKEVVKALKELEKR